MQAAPTLRSAVPPIKTSVSLMLMAAPERVFQVLCDGFAQPHLRPADQPAVLLAGSQLKVGDQVGILLPWGNSVAIVRELDVPHTLALELVEGPLIGRLIVSIEPYSVHSLVTVVSRFRPATAEAQKAAEQQNLSMLHTERLMRLLAHVERMAQQPEPLAVSAA